MPSFTDNSEHSWTVDMNVTVVKRVKAKLEVDLLDVQGTLMARLSTDPVLLVDVLWVILEEQAKEAGITDEQFGTAMGGDAIDAATDALLGGLADFFRSHQRRALRAALVKVKEVEELAADTAIAKIQSQETTDKVTAILNE